jgi:hypothetical protein
MTFRSSIVEKIDTLPNETIHMTFGCVVHLHGHKNKVVPLMKPSILVDLNNGIKFCNCTYWLTNDIRIHRLSCQISNHHMDDKELVPSRHVEIGS